jgi:hypothetical protein
MASLPGLTKAEILFDVKGAQETRQAPRSYQTH